MSAVGAHYTVSERAGCRLVSGSVPMSAMAWLTKGLPPNAVMDAHAARVLGVDVAMGLPEALADLCSKPEVIAEALRRAQSYAPGLDDEALRWLAIGRHGLSSMTLFQRLTGVKLTDDERLPGDTGDFGRCRLLMEQVRSMDGRWDEIAAISPGWAGLVAAWATISEQMDEEAPRWREGVGASPKAMATLLRATRQ